MTRKEIISVLKLKLYFTWLEIHFKMPAKHFKCNLGDIIYNYIPMAIIYNLDIRYRLNSTFTVHVKGRTYEAINGTECYIM